MILYVPAEKVAAAITKNILGYAIIGLAVSVMTLFAIVLNLNSYIRNTMQTDQAEMKIQIHKNNDMLYEIKISVMGVKMMERVKAERIGEEAARKFIDSLDTGTLK